jgi:hypothetical protein
MITKLWKRRRAQYGNFINSQKVSVFKPEEKRPLDRHRHKWKSDIKTYVKEKALEAV